MKIKFYDFYADWCGPCKMVDPMVKKVLVDYPSIEFIKVDVELDKELTARFGITSIPTMIVMKDDVEVSRLNGFNSVDAIQKAIEKAYK